MTRLCRGKRRYETAGAAIRIVDKARDARKHGGMLRGEKRVFYCAICKGWHVTSKDKTHSQDDA